MTLLQLIALEFLNILLLSNISLRHLDQGSPNHELCGSGHVEPYWQLAGVVQLFDSEHHESGIREKEKGKERKGGVKERERLLMTGGGPSRPSRIFPPSREEVRER